MQWLRHTRFEPPTVAEQHQDMMRQERMKQLAAQADVRWAEKPSALDAPDKQQPVQMLQSRDPDSGVTQMNADQEIRDSVAPRRPIDQEAARPAPAEPEPAAEPQQMPRDPPAPPAEDDAPAFTARKRLKKEPKEDSPWKQAAQSQEWQPQGWSPAPAKRRS
jgi:NADH dehydrogenase [ubiquinone] 1 alpha subcomplex assembly factor 2